MDGLFTHDISQFTKRRKNYKKNKQHHSTAPHWIWMFPILSFIPKNKLLLQWHQSSVYIFCTFRSWNKIHQFMYECMYVCVYIPPSHICIRNFLLFLKNHNKKKKFSGEGKEWVVRVHNWWTQFSVCLILSW